MPPTLGLGATLNWLKINEEANEAVELVLSEIKWGTRSLEDWGDDLAISIPSEIDMKGLQDLESELTRLYGLAANNKFLADSFLKTSELSKERAVAKSYRDIVSEPADKRRTVTTIDHAIVERTVKEEDTLLYARIISGFWQTQIDIILKKRDTLKNMFWALKVQIETDAGN